MRYDDAISRHYAAYRPPLHRPILHAALGERLSESGVDLGCGTGRSSVALAEFCDHVTGLDTSDAMLSRAEAHSNVSYRQIADARWPVVDRTADVVTFAGVLPYLDKAATVVELRRVCRPDALILCYDFEVDLTPALSLLGLSASKGSYNHAENLNGCDGISTQQISRWTESLEVPSDAVAHLVLAGRTAHCVLANRFGEGEVFAAVCTVLQQAGWAQALEARCYCSWHGLNN